MKSAKTISPLKRKIYQLRTAKFSLEGNRVYLTKNVAHLRCTLKAQKYALMYSAGPDAFMKIFNCSIADYSLIKSLFA